MCRGLPVNGWKVVQKIPRTKWTDAEGASALLKQKRIARKDITNPAAIRTPKQVMDMLKKKKREIDLSDFMVSESSGTTIATVDDKRDAVIVGDVQGHLKDVMK